MKAPKMSTQVTDVRTPTERGLAESRAGYFKNLMELPQWGYDARRMDVLDPLYRRASSRAREGIAGAYADLGFGPQRVGPQAQAMAKMEEELAETRGAQELSDEEAYRRWVSSEGREAAVPQGRFVTQQQSRPSPFAALMGPVLGGIGYGLGGPLGGAAASAFNPFSRTQAMSA